MADTALNTLREAWDRLSSSWESESKNGFKSAFYSKMEDSVSVFESRCTDIMIETETLQSEMDAIRNESNNIKGEA